MPRSAVVAVLVVATLALCRAGTAGADSTPAPPILVELFTSQGCSSCPAADRLLSQLAESDSTVIALAFHVDYWNHIGWTDPFSSADWTARQRRYAQELGARQIYTPQLVVNGRRHGVGSDRRELSAMLSQAAGDEAAGRLEIEVSESTTSSLSVRLRADFELLGGDSDFVAWVALVEDGLETPVPRGENARRTLLNDRVVRRLEPAAPIDTAGPSRTATLDLRLEPEWKRDRLSIAAFVQDGKSLQVYAAASTPLFR